MTLQEPNFYNLEFSGSGAFWDGAEASPRRTFLMPLSNPAEFLAFGVVGEGQAVHFVARGRVREQLGDFLARMAGEGARVELHARPPLPAVILREYTSDGPFDTAETEQPPPPPKGRLALVELEDSAPAAPVLVLELQGEQPLWPAQATLARRAFLLPLPGHPEEFLAFGVVGTGDTVRFVARGRVGEQLGAFLARLVAEGASVELHAQPPLERVRRYLSQHYTAPATLTAGLVAAQGDTLTGGQQVARG